MCIDACPIVIHLFSVATHMCSEGQAHKMNMHLAGCRYVGTEGVYTHTVAYERDAACPMCSAGVPFSVRSTDTLQQACAPAKISSFQDSWGGWEATFLWT